MNSAAYKLKFGVSKTAYKNMAKLGLLSSGLITSDSLTKWKEIKKERKHKIRVIQQKNHAASVLYKRTNGKKKSGGGKQKPVKKSKNIED